MTTGAPSLGNLPYWGQSIWEHAPTSPFPARWLAFDRYTITVSVFGKQSTTTVTWPDFWKRFYLEEGDLW